jgi:hypothetical protein
MSPNFYRIGELEYGACSRDKWCTLVRETSVNNPAFNVLGSYVGCPAGTWVTSITKGPTTALSGGTTLSAISQLGCAAPATAIAQRYDQCYEEPFPTYNKATN